jgi:hypothetical protein
MHTILSKGKEQGVAEGPKEVLGLAKFAMGGGILGGQSPAAIVKNEGVAEGGNDTVNSLVNLRSTVKQIQTGRAKYPEGFASQLEVALYDAINALRDSQEQGAQNTVNELSELRAVAKQVQTGKMEFPQGYTGHLEWVLYDAIKQIESSSQGIAEGTDPVLARIKKLSGM